MLQAQNADPGGVEVIGTPDGRSIVTVRPRASTATRQRLEQRVVNGPGDFLFIPPGVLHQPINLSATEPAIAIVARNHPQEQEHVELLAPPAPSPR